MRGAPVQTTRPRNTLTVSAATNTGVTEQSTFQTAILSETMQNMITKSMPDERARARFTSNLISIVGASEQLQKCKPATIIAAALRGEGMGLILNHGYYVVPYNDTANFQLGAKGYASLAMATGLYADIDCIDVREGEYIGRDFRTGKPKVDFSIYSSDAERESHPVVGYYAYFELKDGMFRGEYWSIDKCLQHAQQYSSAFKIETFERLRKGEMTPEQERSVRRGSPWYDITGYGFERMCKKTVLKSLLNSGYAPLSNEVRQAMAADNADIAIPYDATNNASGRQSLADIAKEKAAAKAAAPVIDVDEDGVIIEPTPKAEQAKPEQPEQTEKPKKKTTKAGEQMSIENMEG